MYVYVLCMYIRFVCWDNQTCSVCVFSSLCNCNCVMTNEPLWCGLVCQKLRFEFVHLSAFMHFPGREEINPRYECGEQRLVWCTVQYTVQLVHGKLWQSLWTASNYTCRRRCCQKRPAGKARWFFVRYHSPKISTKILVFKFECFGQYCTQIQV